MHASRGSSSARLVGMAVTSAMLVASLAGVAGAFPFGTSIDQAAGADPASVATGDFDGDGNTDVAVANNDDDTVGVLLGNGDGTLDAQVAYAAGVGPASVATADFDGDGDLDLGVANYGGDSVSVLLGAGDGTFGTHSELATGSGAIWVTVADVDGDGDADLLVANENVGEVSVLLGNGDGTFAAADNYPAGSSSESIATGDFDGDGFLDLAVASALDSGVSILIGNGNGTFDVDLPYAAGAFPLAVTAGDFDGDGATDLAVANSFGSSDVSVLLGAGDGTFPTHVEYTTGATPIAVATGDLDGDGDLDLAVTNYAGAADDVSVLLGAGDGTFGAHVTYQAGDGAASIALDMVNGDGALDLVVGNQFTANVSVLLGTASGDTTDPTITITTPPSSSARYELDASVLADYACQDEAGGSGVASCDGPVADGSAIDTASVGTKTFRVDAADNAGNTSTLSHTYVVGYRVLGGFAASVPKASYQRNSNIPIRFRLGNAADVRISDAAAFALVTPTCRVRLVFDGTQQSGCASYDAGTDQFAFDLKTSKLLSAGAHTVEIRVTALDGTTVNTDSATIVLR